MEKKDQEFLARKIRAQYEQKENTGLDQLRALDAKVKKPMKVFGWIYSSLGAIVMGAGMSLVMTDIGAKLGLTATMVPGIVIGILGLGIVLTNWPICKRILDRRKKKFAPQIMELSRKLVEE